MAESPLSFADRTVVVIGGTSGINLGIARGFAEAGARVAVASRSREKVDAAVTTLGSGAFGFSADVRDREALDEGFQTVAEKWGSIDVLVSGAAGNFPAPAAGLSSNGFKSVMDIDLLGTFQVMRAAYPHMRRPGSMINISAPQAYIPMELQVHVCAAKAGVDMVTRVLAMEWGPEGLRVNSIVPGPIDDTEGMRRLAPTDEIRQRVRDSVPLRRNGQARDVANAALFLASPLASYVNGVVLPVDGGWSLGGASVSLAAIKDMIQKQ